MCEAQWVVNAVWITRITHLEPQSGGIPTTPGEKALSISCCFGLCTVHIDHAFVRSDEDIATTATILQRVYGYIDAIAFKGTVGNGDLSSKAATTQA